MKAPVQLLILVPFLLSEAVTAQEITNFRLTIDKRHTEEANARIECNFTLSPPTDSDSVEMTFGGSPELPVERLVVTGENLEGYTLAPKRHALTFYCLEKGPMRIEMRYDYTNLSEYFIYGESGAEIWETGYDEFYYPLLPNRHVNLSVDFLLPDSLTLIASYPTFESAPNRHSCKLQNIAMSSISFAVLQRDLYTRQSIGIPDSTTVWQLRGREAPPERLVELAELTAASISWFGRIYGDTYITGHIGLPTFLFHGGKGFSNRNNVGFISASQQKFADSPDIYPLVHELGHRWLGEWTLLIRDGEPGAYFIKESLNEWMTLQFIRNCFGADAYREQMQKCAEEYATIAGSTTDRPLIAMTRNNNNTIVYRKGPLVLDAVARQYGHETLTNAIGAFYRQWHGRPGLTYDEFIAALRHAAPEAARELDMLVRDRSAAKETPEADARLTDTGKQSFLCLGTHTPAFP